MMAQQRGLAGLGVAQHHQQRVVGEVELDRCEVFLALTDDHPLRARVDVPNGVRRQVRRQQPHRWRAYAGVAGVDLGDLVEVGFGEQEVLGGHGETSARLIGRHRLGRAAQGPDDTHVAVARVVQLELEAQAQTVAHGQRHLEPARGGDDHVDAVGQPDVDQLGDFGQQRVSGVELVGVVAAERVDVVDDQEHLAVPVVHAGGAVAAPMPEDLPPLTSQQQLLEFTEGAPDAFGFQRRGHAADMGEVFERAQLAAAVVQAVERHLARRVQVGGRQDERLQRSGLAGFRTAVDDHVPGRRQCVENQRVTAHLEGLVDLAQWPAPLPWRYGGPGQHCVQRNGVVQRWQPQLRRARPVAGQLLADGGDQLARRTARLLLVASSEHRLRVRLHPPAVNSFGSGADCTTTVFVGRGGS